MKLRKKNILLIIVSAITVASVLICAVLSMTNVCGEEFLSYFSLSLTALDFIFGICSVTSGIIKRDGDKCNNDSDGSDNTSIEIERNRVRSWPDDHDIEFNAEFIVFCILMCLSLACSVALSVMSFISELEWGTVGSIVATVMAVLCAVFLSIVGFMSDVFDIVSESMIQLGFCFLAVLGLTVCILFPIPVLYEFSPLLGFAIILLFLLMPFAMLIYHLKKHDMEFIVSIVLSVLGISAISLGILLTLYIDTYYLLLTAAGIVMNIATNIDLSRDDGMIGIIYTIFFWVCVFAIICVVTQIIKNTFPTINILLRDAFYKWTEWIKEYWWKPWQIP